MWSACESRLTFYISWKKTVEEIGENLESEYGDATHPLYERLTMYLNHIHVNCNYIERIN